MADSSLDAFRHNAWATATLLGYCKGLSDTELNASDTAGTFGSIYWTLQHFVTAEGNYRQILTSEFPRHWGWFRGEKPGLDALEERARDSEAFWEALLIRGVDSDQTVAHRGPEGVEWETRMGVILTQVLNHGNHHRAEIAVMITRLGKDPPDLSGWNYGELRRRRGPR